jgi:hypothetical protein
LQTFQCSLALARRPFPDSPAKLRLIRGTAKSLTVFNTAGGLRRAPGSVVPEKRVQSYAFPAYPPNFCTRKVHGKCVKKGYSTEMLEFTQPRRKRREQVAKRRDAPQVHPAA